MMTYDQWTKETKRLGPITAEFSAVNKAFEELSKNRAPAKEPELMKKLAQALKTWLVLKGDGWKKSKRNSTKLNGKGTIERLIEDLSRSPLCRGILGKFAVQGPVVESIPSKVIVFSGHGSWDVRDPRVKAYYPMPNNSTIKFYTMNLRTLSDSFGGDLDRGIIAGVRPDQEVGPSHQAPNMKLYPPTGLHIRSPNRQTWQVIKLRPGIKVPRNNMNLQIRIDASVGEQTGYTLDHMIDNFLRPAIQGVDSVTFLWAACRAIELQEVTGKGVGVNTMQR
jgi:hypothetical protein